MQPADEPFIFRAWLEGYWPNFPGNLVMRKSEFLERWHRVIERILADPQTRTVVAHVEGKPEALLGFACGCPECVHWAYTKQPFRKLGIGGKMLAEFGAALDMIGEGRCSHWFDGMERLRWPYVPELLRRYA
jgi:GNAT superfamily N-acetyltransferase